MSDFEKLVELINTVCEHHADNLLQPFGAETLAAHLIDNGVTVKQMQKPLTIAELYQKYDCPMWFEELYHDVERLPLLLYSIGAFYATFAEYGSDQRLERRIGDYNYSWRCWASEPTDEERKAAEWE